MYGEAGLQGCLKRVPGGSTLLNLLTLTHSLYSFSLFYELCTAYHSVSKQHMNTRGHARNLSIATARNARGKSTFFLTSGEHEGLAVDLAQKV